MTKDRSALADTFLDAAGWGDAARAPLAGDASNRRYLRLRHPDGTSAVLMDAPRERGEDARPFLRIARHLSGLGLSAPTIVAEDVAHGFLLLEDLGDALFARLLEQDPAQQDRLYSAATDLLLRLHAAPPPVDLPAYDADMMTNLALLAFDWYAAPLGGNDSITRAAAGGALHAALARHAPETDVLVLRDYHAENLIWLPDRHGDARVGLLDFQDALRGHPAYDLVSLVRDARRDVPPALATRMIARYAGAAGRDLDDFTTACAVLGAQRNMRILGVFARLCLRDGKAHYVDLIPRVWAHLQHDLAHPVLAALRSILRDALPHPTPETLQRLKDKCGQHPTP